MTGGRDLLFSGFEREVGGSEMLIRYVHGHASENRMTDGYEAVTWREGGRIITVDAALCCPEYLLDCIC